MTELLHGWPCPTCGRLITEGEEAVDALRGEDVSGFGKADDYAWVPVKFHPGHFRSKVGGDYYRLVAPEH